MPNQMQKRRFIFDTIRDVFERYGYRPIETPVMESLETLAGKYGEEGDQLLFKVLNNGDYLAKADSGALERKDSKALLRSISKRGLRYDLTVPFARFVAMHQNDLNFPFKRYAIQPVWRADRPQKGRYQEFYQCDVDVVGSDSLMYEAEFVSIYDEVFERLKIPVRIKVNNRKILAGIAEIAGIGGQFVDFATAIDKLDKMGREKVIADLVKRGIESAAAEKALSLMSHTSLEGLAADISTSEIGAQGIDELRTFHSYLDQTTCTNEVALDVTLARGLSYYTGCIIEVEALNVSMGSIGGGGRYDDLTGNFGLKGLSGVGISFGAERIYDVMEELELFPDQQLKSVDAICLAMDPESHRYAYKVVNTIRRSGIAIDMYPEPAKFKKQMKYAAARGFAYVLIIGETERNNNVIKLKTMSTGEQQDCSVDEIVTILGE